MTSVPPRLAHIPNPVWPSVTLQSMKLCCVDIDFATAGRMAVDCLYSKGHRSAMFLRDNETDYDRGSGYVLLFRKALLERAEELGMTIHESSKHRDDRFDAAEFVRELRSLDERPTRLSTRRTPMC